MKIKDGYNSEPWEIVLNGRDNGAELWIKGKFPGTQKDEILTYVTLQELADLKKEVEQALRDTLKI